jgi:ATP/maltotriose-dependent transcriptional regulator MalT
MQIKVNRGLPPRETELLPFLCKGLSDHEIADRLVLSVGTVKTHIHNIFRKLGVRDRPQAIASAMQLSFFGDSINPKSALHSVTSNVNLRPAGSLLKYS